MHLRGSRSGRVSHIGRWVATLLAVLGLVMGTAVPAAASATTTATANATAAATATTAPASTSVASVGSIGGPGKMSLAGWSAGNIISDAVFTNKSTLNEAQIQSVLNAKASRCQAGYTCLKDFRLSTPSRGADKYCNGYTGEANESAARILYKVAQSCGINPQVLIVMLQKEQGLVTHPYPTSGRYAIAMGFNCPDTAPCDVGSAGFFTQVYGAARQMQVYMEGRYFTWYAPGKTWNILYNTSTACGSAPVYVANRATSALYYYTPYQPNAAALAAGYGEAPCGAYGNRNFYNYFTDWFGSTRGPQEDPIGVVETIESLPGEFRVRGWALDPNVSDSIAIHVYAGATGYAFTANTDRPDVGAAYPGKGNAHGFDVRIPATEAGSIRLCIYGINLGAGSNSTLRCEDTVGRTGSPVGFLDSAVGVDGAVEVSGWALDPDSKNSIAVHVYVGSSATTLIASRSRSDVGTQYPVYGDAHGFGARITAPSGQQSVCAYGINVGNGDNVLLGCTTVTVPPAKDPGRAPVGHVEGMVAGPGGATVSGWAYDPDTTEPITVRIAVDGVSRTYRADKDRPDFGSAYPGLGSRHGFNEFVPMSVGSHQVCVYVVNDGAGESPLIVCSTVKITSPVDQGRSPIGFVESIVPEPGGATVKGWAFDPDTTDPIEVHVYINGVGKAFLADDNRSDIVNAFPEAGPKSGFSEFISMSVGTHEVCVYAINNGVGGNPTLACRSVKVTVPVDLGRSPVGFVESITPSDGGVKVAGWAFDLDTVDPIQVHIYVDGVGKSFTADRSRPDVAAAYSGAASRSGFSELITMPAGTHRVCVYAINAGVGGNPLISCSSVTVPASTPKDQARVPKGFLENVAPGSGGATLTGWAFDPDTTDSIQVHVYVNGVGTSLLADGDRLDVATAYPGVGSKHGFSRLVPMPSGSNQVCLYAINDGAGGNPLITCATVRVP